jgi:hypothetical protein
LADLFLAVAYENLGIFFFGTFLVNDLSGEEAWFDDSPGLALPEAEGIFCGVMMKRGR